MREKKKKVSKAQMTLLLSLPRLSRNKSEMNKDAIFIMTTTSANKAEALESLEKCVIKSCDFVSINGSVFSTQKGKLGSKRPYAA
jgi:hypothetical protein